MKIFFMTILLLGVVQSARAEKNKTQEEDSYSRDCENLEEQDPEFKKKVLDCMAPSDWALAKIPSNIVKQ